jgi:hypothetical protein
MVNDCQQIAEAFRKIFSAAMTINEVLGRRDDLNDTVPPEWPLHLSADEFAHDCLDMAEHYEALAARMPRPCQHRDDGRGRCIDCGTFLPSADGSHWR